MTEKREIPERTCCACRKKDLKANLMAVVRLKDGRITVSADGKTYGRSAYLCRNKSCLEKIRSRKGGDPVSASLKTKVPAEIWDEVDSLINGKNKKHA